jgi:hypothetical protein
MANFIFTLDHADISSILSDYVRNNYGLKPQTIAFETSTDRPGDPILITAKIKIDVVQEKKVMSLLRG